MKILLAVDGSEFSQAAVEEVIRRSWPSGTEVRVLSIVHPFPFPFVPDPAFVGVAAHYDSLDQERKRASRDVDKAAAEIRERAPELKVAIESLEGSPKKMIVEEAEHWGADLIIPRLAWVRSRQAVSPRVGSATSCPSRSLFRRSRAQPANFMSISKAFCCHQIREFASWVLRAWNE